MNAACDTLLDDGDFDFISADKCKLLIEMLYNLPENLFPLNIIKQFVY